MTQVIIYTNENGNVTTCFPTGEVPIEQVLEKDVPKNVDAKIVNYEDLPYEHDCFFNAWELVNGNVIVNLQKAKEITKTRLREQRKPLLEVQDVAFQRALETNQDTSEIVKEKQRLRDITKLADQATSLDELKNLKVEK